MRNTNISQQQVPKISSWDDHVDDEIDVPHIVGTCPYMCPVQERLKRERLRDLHVFERLNGNPGKSSPSLAVKKFCRTISSNQVTDSDVRPVSVLLETLDYLFGLWSSREQPFEVVHDFLFDRTRSIRQDLSMQNIINTDCIFMYERMVRFHVLSHHRLQKVKSTNVSSILPLNLEQLTKSLMTLFNLYEANRSSESIYENEAEFCSFYVLLHVHPAKQGKSLSLWFPRISSTILKSKEMRFARKVLRYSRLGNYKRFIHTIEAEASYLQYCVVEPFINEIRAVAVCYLNNGGYKLQPLPLEYLSKVLLLHDSDVQPFCIECGLQMTSDSGTRCLPTKQSSFCHPKGFQKYFPLVSERLQRASAEL